MKCHDVGWSIEIVYVGVGLSVDVLERLVAHKFSVVSVAPEGRGTVRVAVLYPSEPFSLPFSNPSRMASVPIVDRPRTSHDIKLRHSPWPYESEDNYPLSQ